MPLCPPGSTVLTGHFAKSRATAAASRGAVSILIRASIEACDSSPVRSDFQRALTWVANAGSVISLGNQLLTLRLGSEPAVRPWYCQPLSLVPAIGEIVFWPPTPSAKL